MPEPTVPQGRCAVVEHVLTGPLVEKLSRRDHLSAEEKTVLADILDPPTRVTAGDDIVSQYQRPTHSTLLLDGFAARYVVLMDGARQITEVNVPGTLSTCTVFC